MITNISELLDKIKESYEPATSGSPGIMDLTVHGIMDMADEFGLEVTLSDKQQILSGMEQRGFELQPQDLQPGFVFLVRKKVIPSAV